MKILLLMMLAAPMALAQTSTVNFSGRWQIEPPAGRGGRGGGGRQVLVLNQVGNNVTGELGSGRGNASTGAPATNDVWDGKVSGNSITFYVWRGNDRPAKTFYKGEMNAAGDEINFTVTGDPAGRGGVGAPSGTAGTGAAPTQVVAKRAR